jgi:Protein of unknown function (DUF3352)
MTTCCPSGTFLARKSLISLCVASVLGAAAFLGGDPAPATAKALDPALLFPAGTVLTLSFDGKPLEEHGKELAISKIWNEPEVQEFLKAPLELLEEQSKGGIAMITQQLGVSEKDLEGLSKARIAVGVTRFEMPEDGSGTPSFDLMLAADLRGSQKTAEALLKGIDESMLKDATVGGVAGKAIDVPGGGPFDSVTWIFHEGWLIAGTSKAQLEAALARAKSGDQAGSLGSEAFYAAGMKDVAKPNTIFSFYMNYATVLKLITDAQPMVKEMLAGAGLDAFKSLTFGMDLDGPSIRERMFVGITPGSPMMKIYAPMDVSGVLARIPKRAVAAYAGSLKLKEYVDYTVAMFKKTPASDQVDEGLAEVDKILGAGWREELLPNLGPEMAAFLAMPKYGFIPEIGLLLKVGDKAKVEAALAKVFDATDAKAAHKTLKFLDSTINVVDLGAMKIDKDLNLRPAYVFTGDYLLVTPSPHTAKSLLVAMNNKDGGLGGQEAFAKEFARMKGGNADAANLGVMYLDLPWLAGFMIDSAIPLIQSAVSPRDLKEVTRELEGVEIDLAKLPTSDAFVKHLGPMMGLFQLKEGGVYADMVSPTGMIGSFMSMAAVGGMVGATRSTHAVGEDEQPERAGRKRARAVRAVPAPATRPTEKDEDKDR